MKIVDISNLIYEVTIESISFHVRSLSVFEYINLINVFQDNPAITIGSSIWQRISETCLVGWENCIVENLDYFEGYEYGEQVELDFDRVYIQFIPKHILVELGRHIYENLSSVSEEDELKYRGFTRFISFLNDKENETRNRKSFECEHCIKTGLINYRNCGLKNLDELKIKYGVETPVEEKINPVAKYSSKKRKRFASKEQAEEALKKDAYADNDKSVYIGKFKFPECPVSWIDPHIGQITSVFYHCIHTNSNFFPGSVSEQPYKWFKLQEIVKSENNKIEQEEFEKRK